MTDSSSKSDSNSNTADAGGRATSSPRNRIFTAPLPDPISRNIETIVSLQTREVEDLPMHQQRLEGIARFFGKPIFMYALVASLAIWILGDILHQAGILSFFWPPFNWSDQGLDAAALLISTGVLVRQSRQENFAEQRAQLMLQLNLLSEQKIAKIIELVEELRTDLPQVKERSDSEAQVMREPVDPLEVVDVLQKNLADELILDP